MLTSSLLLAQTVAPPAPVKFTLADWVWRSPHAKLPTPLMVASRLLTLPENSTFPAPLIMAERLEPLKLVILTAPAPPTLTVNLSAASESAVRLPTPDISSEFRLFTARVNLIPLVGRTISCQFWRSKPI